MTKENQRQRIAAIVVLYHPDPVILKKLLASIHQQVDFIIVLDNGNDEELVLPLLTPFSNIRYQAFDQNYGLGFALNYGFNYATKMGANYIATFDQDSIASNGMINALVQSHIDLKKKGVKCAAISPIFYDIREKNKDYFPVYQEVSGKILSIKPSIHDHKLLNVDYLITSGMLINTQAWIDDIQFDDRFFVDYTDVEWCFRCRSKGYQIYVNCKIEMGHTLSDASRKPILGLSLLQYTPIRRYYFYRNVIHFCKLNYVSTAWSRRLLKSLLIKYLLNPIVDPSPWASIKMMSLGIFHGIQGRLGRY